MSLVYSVSMLILRTLMTKCAIYKPQDRVWFYCVLGKNGKSMTWV